MEITGFDFNMMEQWGGHFKGIASRNEDGSVSLDVFDVYKISETVFVVKENGEERYQGGLFTTIQYCAKWL